MTRQLRIVDVFTEEPLAGNQLAVVLDGTGMPAELMQRVAREMNFSETTFILPPDDPAHAARVRIFTPGVELPFAGHPTIGTAWVMWSEGLVPSGSSTFVLEEGVGPVPVSVVQEDGRTTVWMSHPRLEFGRTFRARADMARALGLAESDLVPEVPIQVATTGNPFFFVALRDRDAVDAATSDSARLAELFGDESREGVFLFAADGPGRLYSRMFAGHVLGIKEDPATGSASGPLGAFAVRYGLVARAPEVALVSEQGTKMGRRSLIHIRLGYGDDPLIPTRIEVGGSVAPIVSGTVADL